VDLEALAYALPIQRLFKFFEQLAGNATLVTVIKKVVGLVKCYQRPNFAPFYHTIKITNPPFINIVKTFFGQQLRSGIAFYEKDYREISLRWQGKNRTQYMRI
jgi:hypothetical protein